MTFSATNRWSRVSCALKTSPIPPAPSEWTTVYGPSRSPGFRFMECPPSVSEPEVASKPMQVIRMQSKEPGRVGPAALGLGDGVEHEPSLHLGHGRVKG